MYEGKIEISTCKTIQINNVLERSQRLTVQMELKLAVFPTAKMLKKTGLGQS